MTREEAIAYGKRVIDLGLNDETQAFCELAIKALEQQSCEDWNAVLDELIRIGRNAFKDDTDYDNLFNFISNLPNVTPQPKEEPQQKTGHWIKHKHNGKPYFNCSECLYFAPIGYSYCPECGARMEAKE